ncbi:hypothetical protein A2U01_0093054, partial [Trifolium medium]|nr:hypothetical protein [Trifolium medium]
VQPPHSLQRTVDEGASSTFGCDRRVEDLSWNNKFH